MGSLGSWQLYPTMHLLVLFKIICLVILWHIARTKIWRFSIEQPAVAACAVLVILCILDTPHFEHPSFWRPSFPHLWVVFCKKKQILAVLLQNFVAEIYALFLQNILNWKAETETSFALNVWIFGEPPFGHPLFWTPLILETLHLQTKVCGFSSWYFSGTGRRPL